jgi:hypothetical protein
MKKPNFRKELITAMLLLAFGIALLPALIYFVGTTVVGPFEDAYGLAGLYTNLLQALVEPQVAAWLLVVSPYLVVQLLRAVIALRPSRGNVSQFTD